MNPIDLVERVIEVMHKPPETEIVTERSDNAPGNQAWGAWRTGDEDGLCGRGPTRDVAIARLREMLS
jgi:hypothetical protein